MTDLPPLGKYVRLRELGRGGMGVVYEAHDPALNRHVALKVLRRAESAADMARLEREAALVAGLSHPGIVGIYELGVADEDGQPTLFVAMPLIEGPDLARGMEDMSLRTGARVLAQVAEAAGHAHTRGLCHRDIKPANILLTPEGRAVLTDFGLAKGPDSLTVTHTDAMIGTPHYMAPELVRATPEAHGPRADVWSLGVILYEMLTATRPFDADSADGIFYAILESDPAAPHSLEPSAPPGLVAVCLKALEKSPDLRYADASALAVDLRRWLDGQPVTARRPSALRNPSRWLRRRPVLVTTLAVCALLIGAAVLWSKRTPHGTSPPLPEAAQPPENPNAPTTPPPGWAAVTAATQALRAGKYDPTGDVVSLRRELEAVLTPLTTSAGSETDPRLLETLGIGWFHAGDHARAAKLLTIAARRAPAEGQAAYYLGRIALSDALELMMKKPEGDNARRAARAAARASEAAGWFEEARAAGYGTGAFERHLVQTQLAQTTRDVKKIRALCAEGLARFGSQLGVEQYHALLATATSGRAALPHLRRGLAVRPHDAWLLFVRGVTVYHLGDARSALADFTRSIQIAPYRATVFHSRAQCLLHAGKDEAARPDLDRAIALDPQAAEPYADRAKTRISAGDLEGALADVTRAVELAPDFALVRRNRARIFMDLGKPADALLDLERAIALQPEVPHAHFERGRANFQLERFEDAIRDLSVSIGLNDKLGNAYYLRCQARLALGRHTEALADATAQLRLEPRNTLALRTRGKIRFTLRDFPGALADCNALIAIEPKEPAHYDNRCNVYLVTRKLDPAQRDIDASLRLAPGNRQALWNRAYLHRLRKPPRNDLALADYGKIIAANPKDTRALIERAGLHARAENHAAALADYDQARLIVPDHFGLRINRGATLVALGRLADAAQDLRHATKLAPDQWLGWFHLGRCLGRQGDSVGAREALTRARTAAPARMRAVVERALALLPDE